MNIEKRKYRNVCTKKQLKVILRASIGRIFINKATLLFYLSCGVIFLWTDCEGVPYFSKFLKGSTYRFLLIAQDVSKQLRTY